MLRHIASPLSDTAFSLAFKKKKASGSEEPSGSYKRARPNASDFASISAAQPAPALPSQPLAVAVQPAVLLQEFLHRLPSPLSPPSLHSPLLRAVVFSQHPGQVPDSLGHHMRHLLCPGTLNEQRKLERTSRRSLKYRFSIL